MRSAQQHHHDDNEDGSSLIISPDVIPSATQEEPFYNNGTTTTTNATQQHSRQTNTTTTKTSTTTAGTDRGAAADSSRFHSDDLLAFATQEVGGGDHGVGNAAGAVNNNGNHRNDNSSNNNNINGDDNDDDDDAMLPPPARPDVATSGGHDGGGVVENISRINGRGMWRSWTRNFISPLYAFLDLFDNSVDATLHDGFHGRIHLYKDRVRSSDDEDDDDGADAEPGEDLYYGFCMLNNSVKKISDLKRVLEVYGSKKGNDDIGENGVGVKQACASLSDLSFVITKNKRKVQIGLIAEKLQKKDGCYLPSYTLSYDTLKDDMARTAFDNQSFRVCLSEYGHGNAYKGSQRIMKHIRMLYEHGIWANEEHLFLIVLHRTRNNTSPDDGGGGAAGVGDDTDNNNPTICTGTEELLEELKQKIPRYYLHIPSRHYEVVVNDEKLHFQYWERRLVELHAFPIVIDPKNPFTTAKDWHMPNAGYQIHLFIGFDPHRLDAGTNNKAQLFIHSRKSGRLVKTEQDARAFLGLGSSGSDFNQGLTIILDDRHCKLPLTPTKQDIAFGEEGIKGQIHKLNLFCWIAAFTQMYWKHFFDYYKMKSTLREHIMKYRNDVTELIKDPASSNKTIGTFMNHHRFSTCQELSFSNKLSKIDSKIVCTNRETSSRWISGPDTFFRLGKKLTKEQKHAPKMKALKNEMKDYIATTRSSTGKRKEISEQQPSTRGGSELPLPKLKKRRSESHQGIVNEDEQEERELLEAFDDDHGNDDPILGVATAAGLLFHDNHHIHHQTSSSQQQQQQLVGVQVQVQEELEKKLKVSLEKIKLLERECKRMEVDKGLLKKVHEHESLKLHQSILKLQNEINTIRDEYKQHDEQQQQQHNEIVNKLNNLISTQQGQYKQREEEQKRQYSQTVAELKGTIEQLKSELSELESREECI